MFCHFSLYCFFVKCILLSNITRKGLRQGNSDADESDVTASQLVVCVSHRLKFVFRLFMKPIEVKN